MLLKVDEMVTHRVISHIERLKQTTHSGDYVKFKVNIVELCLLGKFN